MAASNPAIRTVADIDNVREVTLAGSADAAAWEPLLRGRGLRPVAEQGAVAIELMATELRWKGITFREWSVAVTAQPLDAPADAPAGGYLAQAFNSSALLAWAERTLFKTPYRHAQIAADSEPPIAMAVRPGGKTALRASMAGRPAAATRRRDWQSVVFLPSAGGRQWRQFDVRLAGEQAVYPFAEGGDEFALAATEGYPVFGWLLDSRFRPQEWRICQQARHRKSQTYRQPGADAG